MLINGDIAMNRTNLAVILLLVIMLTGVVSQAIQVKNGSGFYELRVEEVSIEGIRPKIKVSNASWRLIHDCRLLVVESLTVAKLTVNVVFDVAIEIID